jgi:hypothetical protein
VCECANQACNVSAAKIPAPSSTIDPGASWSGHCATNVRGCCSQRASSVSKTGCGRLVSQPRALWSAAAKVPTGPCPPCNVHEWIKTQARGAMSASISLPVCGCRTHRQRQCAAGGGDCRRGPQQQPTRAEDKAGPQAQPLAAHFPLAWIIIPTIVRDQQCALTFLQVASRPWGPLFGRSYLNHRLSWNAGFRQ